MIASLITSSLENQTEFVHDKVSGTVAPDPADRRCSPFVACGLKPATN